MTVVRDAVQEYLCVGPPRDPGCVLDVLTAGVVLPMVALVIVHTRCVLDVLVAGVVLPGVALVIVHARCVLDALIAGVVLPGFQLVMIGLVVLVVRLLVTSIMISSGLGDTGTAWLPFLVWCCLLHRRPTP